MVHDALMVGIDWVTITTRLQWGLIHKRNTWNDGILILLHFLPRINKCPSVYPHNGRQIALWNNGRWKERSRHRTSLPWMEWMGFGWSLCFLNFDTLNISLWVNLAVEAIATKVREKALSSKMVLLLIVAIRKRPKMSRMWFTKVNIYFWKGFEYDYSTAKANNKYSTNTIKLTLVVLIL